MIYLDSSAVLAQLFAEDKTPDEAVWRQDLVSSRLTEYEVWTRIHARNVAVTHGDAARDLLGRINIVELTATALQRALRPFPLAVRTLDGLHLATMDFLRGQGMTVELLSYDKRLLETAVTMSFPIYGR